jgi:hypothetical protein
MSESLVMKSQANEVFQNIQMHEIPPEDFEWNILPSIFNQSVYVSRLRHKSSGFYFQFDFHNNRHFCEFSPGNTTPIEQDFPGTWENQIEYLNSWLNNLQREIEAPDLWGAIANEKVLAEGSSEQDENVQFTREEIHRIHENLNEIKHYLISSQPFSPEQLNYLDARFNYLEEAATRVGRKDWIILVVGTLTNTIITLALIPSIARELLRLAGTVLSWVFNIHLLK